MINYDPNMSRKQIMEKLPLPHKIENREDFLSILYKGVFIAVKLLLDIRLNLVKISEGKTIKTKYKEVKNTPKVDNAVIKKEWKIK